MKEFNMGVPQKNRQIEHVNRMPIDVLTKLSIDDPSKWYKRIDQFEVLTGIGMQHKEDLRTKNMIEEEIMEKFQAKKKTHSMKYAVGDLVLVKRTKWIWTIAS